MRADWRTTVTAAVLAVVTMMAIWGDGQGGVAEAALALGALGGAGVAAVSVSGRGVSPIVLACALAWSLLATLHGVWAPAPDDALRASAALGVGLVWLVVGSAGSRARVARIATALAWLGVGVAAVSWKLSRGEVPASAPFGNPARLAAFLLLPLALIACRWERAHAARDSFGARRWALALAVVSLALQSTGSRAGLLAGGIVFGLAWARPPVRWSFAGLAVAALATMLLPLGFPDWLPWADADGESSVGIRWQLYGLGSEGAWTASPWGVGLGGFADAFLAVRPESLAYAPRHAHHEGIRIAWELGAPGLLLAVASLFAWVRAIGRDDRTSAAALIVLGVAVFGLFDAVFSISALMIPLAFLVGGAVSRANEPRVPRLALALSGGLFLGALVLGWGEWRAERALASARDAFARGDFVGSQERSREVLRWRPRRVEAWSLIAEAGEADTVVGGGGRSVERPGARGPESRRRRGAASRFGVCRSRSSPLEARRVGRGCLGLRLRRRARSGVSGAALRARRSRPRVGARRRGPGGPPQGALAATAGRGRRRRAVLPATRARHRLGRAASTPAGGSPRSGPCAAAPGRSTRGRLGARAWMVAGAGLARARLVGGSRLARSRGARSGP